MSNPQQPQQPNYGGYNSPYPPQQTPYATPPGQVPYAPQPYQQPPANPGYNGYQAPPQGQYPPQPQYGQPPRPPKKGPSSVVVGLGVLLFLALGVGLVVILAGAGKSTTGQATPTAASSAAGTATPAAQSTTVSANSTTGASATTAAATTPKAGATATPKAGATTAATAGNGWPVYKVASSGFSLSLPQGWQQVDEDTYKAFLEKGLDAVKDGGSISSSLQDQIKQAFASGLIKFYGYNPNAAGFADNMNIIKQPIPSSVTLDQLVSANSSQLSTQFHLTKDVAQNKVRLPVGNAVVLTYAYSVNVQGRDVEIDVSQYIFIADNSAYILSFSSAPERSEENSALFRTVADSFQLTK
ncbi:MAG TPA: hypothetical protein VH186_17210 [Chloroflexia bacterium]|nr:hypothetical protein [Chloroflexia bacterium]